MIQLIREMTRTSLVLWAKTGKAPGLLYSVIDRHAKKLGAKKRRRRLTNGVLIDCDLADHVQQQVYFFGAYEPIEASLFLSLIPKGGVVVDAGANVGFYTLMMAERVGVDGEVHSFEPVPRNYAALRQNIELNPDLRQIKSWPSALWHQTEALHFSVASQHQNNCGGYSAGKVQGALETVSCSAIPLTDHFEKNQITRLDALKMDIEGAELFALRGMLPLLRKYQPVILLEVCRSTCKSFDYSPEDLWALLKPLGYKIYQIESVFGRSAWVSDFSQMDQKNVLLIPERLGDWKPQWNDKEVRRKYADYQLFLR